MVVCAHAAERSPCGVEKRVEIKSKMKHEPFTKIRTYPCKWAFDESTGAWSAACGMKFWFDFEGPKTNKFEFCPRCGKKVVEV